MKALLSHTPGPPDTLRLDTVADPVAGPGEVVLNVRACGINFFDALVIEDKYQHRPPRPFSPGAEVAGIIDSVGPGVDLKPGTRAMGWAAAGGMAEKILLKASRCTPIPDALPDDTAAALMVNYGTSLHALKDRGQLGAGDTLLVLGAAGGVGLAAVELGKAMGARVVAAASTQEKVDMARKHGADDGVVYPTGALSKDQSKALSAAFKAACGAAGANVIYDGVGGDYAEPALRSIAWQGRYLVVGFTAGIPSIPLNLLLLKGCQAVGVYWGGEMDRAADSYTRCANELIALYLKGLIKPEVSKRFPLAQGGDAIRHLASRQAIGKVVVTVSA